MHCMGAAWALHGHCMRCMGAAWALLRHAERLLHALALLHPRENHRARRVQATAEAPQPCLRPEGAARTSQPPASPSASHETPKAVGSVYYCTTVLLYLRGLGGREARARTPPGRKPPAHAEKMGTPSITALSCR